MNDKTKWQRFKETLHLLLHGHHRIRAEAEWVASVNDEAERVLARKGLRIEGDVIAGRGRQGK